LDKNSPNTQAIWYLFFLQELLKDFSENDFTSINTELQQVLSNRKEMTQFLKEWLSTPFDIEKLKNGIQKENNSICQVNKFYNNKINVSTNFYYATLFFLLCF
jgi:centromeric protein E